jgi:hypothetical protein
MNWLVIDGAFLNVKTERIQNIAWYLRSLTGASQISG